jgi:hypothetical protein
MTLRMSRSIAPGIVLASLVAGACGSGGNGRASRSPAPPYAPTIVPAQFSEHVTNRYYPLVPGTTFSYDGTKDGAAQHNEVTVTHDTKTVLGVRCVVVHDVVTQEGSLIEETDDWYAQDSAGNVWYFGEDTKEYENGKVTGTAGTWEAGVDGAQPGIVMEAAPQVGDSYRQEYYAGQAEDTAKVLDLSASVTVANGSYTGALVTEETTPLEPDQVEHKSYAPGIGFISGTLVQGGSEEIELVSVHTE